MTLILAAKDRKGRVFVGADTRGSNGYYYHRQHNYVVGCSGSFRVGHQGRRGAGDSVPTPSISSPKASTSFSAS